MTTFVVDASGNIINAVVLEDGAAWSPPDGCSIATGEYAVGGTLIGGVYTAPPASVVPIDAHPVVAVTPRQARLALLAAGLLDQVDAAVDAAGGATKITWEYATEIRRDDPMISTVGAALSLTSDQIDALFTAAGAL
ncbi:hypothetical protein [Bradyrhizobium pachyrhizi]|uniref:hypothetical protein n=1 Tax=Bradyrhizobium pachyrhizi TaxID=280333 RepID=UPI00067B7C16|nr:hypothetical protein [Bradyrhizobium pachyrhizi]